jgi:hypothetical protein
LQRRINQCLRLVSQLATTPACRAESDGIETHTRRYGSAHRLQRSLQNFGRCFEYSRTRHGLVRWDAAISCKDAHSSSILDRSTTAVIAPRWSTRMVSERASVRFRLAARGRQFPDNAGVERRSVCRELPARYASMVFNGSTAFFQIVCSSSTLDARTTHEVQKGPALPCQGRVSRFDSGLVL